jgi:hypothetical protein
MFGARETVNFNSDATVMVEHILCILFTKTDRPIFSSRDFIYKTHKIFDNSILVSAAPVFSPNLNKYTSIHTIIINYFAPWPRAKRAPWLFVPASYQAKLLLFRINTNFKYSDTNIPLTM